MIAWTNSLYLLVWHRNSKNEDENQLNITPYFTAVGLESRVQHYQNIFLFSYHNDGSWTILHPQKKENTQHKLALKFRTILKRRTLQIQNCIYTVTCLVSIGLTYFIYTCMLIISTYILYSMHDECYEKMSKIASNLLEFSLKKILLHIYVFGASC